MAADGGGRRGAGEAARQRRCFAEIRGARLIDCTGLNGDCTKLDQPLLTQIAGAAG